MRYASIRSMDTSNGKGIGVSLFVQGCNHHCKNCFNPETWDFNDGKEFTSEVESKFLKLVSQPFIKRVSFLGGDPLSPQNINEVFKLIDKIPDDKSIWIWTGYTWEYLINNLSEDRIKLVDYIVDGPYIDELNDLKLKFRGSSNQRIISVKDTLSRGEIILYDC